MIVSDAEIRESTRQAGGFVSACLIVILPYQNQNHLRTRNKVLPPLTASSFGQLQSVE